VSEGLTIIDMTDPENIESHIWSPPLWVNNTIDSLRTCHNIYIDDDGYGYLAGCNVSNGGIIIIDLFTDPINPTMVGYADQSYSHDVYVKGDRMYSSEIHEGWFAIYDISDKTNPQRIATQETGTTFTHNAWTSDDQNYIFTTDERANAYLEAYEISDLTDIERLDSYRPPVTEGNGVIPHNTHYEDGFLVTSWYTDGIVVVDGNKPDNLVKVAGYDTWLGVDGGFNGCWGAYPFLPSGLILASDRTNGLYVFNPTYARACYLEGNIISAGTGLPINGVTFTINSPDQLARAQSNAAGDFKTGIATSGSYDVVVSHPDFDDQIINVDLSNGEVTILNVELIKPNSSVFTSTVVRDVDNEIMPGALIKLVNAEGRVDEFVADANGNNLLELPDGVYDMYAGSWGYKIGHFQFDTNTDPLIEVRLEEGYRDEFFFDLGWEFSGDADEGSFTVGVPQELFLVNNIINTAADNQEDIGTQALLTGDGTNHPIHLDYVKNGTARAVSPVMDLSGYDYPFINFDLFYRHDGIIDPGSYTLDVAIVRDGESRTIRQFEMSDIFTEVAVDVFEVVEGTPSALNKFTETELLIYPNPSHEEFNISLESLDFDQYQLVDVNGKLLINNRINDRNFTIDGSSLNPGIYFLQLRSDQKMSKAYRIVKQ